MLNTGKATIVDVREPSEFISGHNEGAINIPLSQLQKRLDEFRQMSQPLILVCRSGSRSGMAAALLKAYGISEAYNGGAWDDVEMLRRRAA